MFISLNVECCSYASNLKLIDYLFHYRSMNRNDLSRSIVCCNNRAFGFLNLTLFLPLCLPHSYCRCGDYESTDTIAVICDEDRIPVFTNKQQLLIGLTNQVANLEKTLENSAP